MRSSGSAFKHIDRGFPTTLLLIPGWATDHRVFAPLDLDFNYLVPTTLSPADFADTCAEALDEAALKTVSVLGWSMGGFLASDLLKKHPEKISELVLIGMRDRYETAQLAEVRSYLEKSRTGYLYKFYAECFSADERDLSAWFKANLLKVYLRDMEAGPLLEGLDYLASARLDIASMNAAMIRFIHGSRDRIAPEKTITEVRDALPRAEFRSIDGAGHMPFLRNGFKEIFHGR